MITSYVNTAQQNYFYYSSKSAAMRTVTRIQSKNMRPVPVCSKKVKRQKKNARKKKISKKLLFEYLKEEFELSTTHGLPYIVKPNIHWCERLFWGTSFVFCLCLVYVLLAPLYRRYTTHPTVTSVEMDYFNWNISYPAITLCPDYKTDDEAFALLVDYYRNKTGEDLSSYLWSISNVNLFTIERIDLQTSEIIPLISPSDYAKIAAESFMRFDRSRVTTTTDWEISMEPVMTEHGMCHVINSNVAVFDDPTKWNLEQAEYKENNIKLSIYDGEFFTQIIDYADIYKIFVHNPDEIISSNTASFNHISQSFLFIGVMVYHHKLSEQLKTSDISFRKCRLRNEPISARYPIYSYNHCLNECKIRMIKKLCGCVPHWYKYLAAGIATAAGDIVLITRYYLQSALMDFPLLSIRYRPAMMALSLDADTLAQFADTKDLPRSFKDCGCLTNCEGFVYLKDHEEQIPHSTLTRVKIGVTTFPKMRIVIEVIFGFYDIVLRSGGVVNLCIGCSLISIMELIMTALRPIVYIIVQAIKDRYNKK